MGLKGEISEQMCAPMQGTSTVASVLYLGISPLFLTISPSLILIDYYDIPCGCCDRNEDDEPCEELFEPTPWTVHTPSAPNPVPLMPLGMSTGWGRYLYSLWPHLKHFSLTTPLLQKSSSPCLSLMAGSSPSAPQPDPSPSPPGPSPPDTEPQVEMSACDEMACNFLFVFPGNEMVSESMCSSMCIPQFVSGLFEMFGFGCGSVVC